MLLLSTDFKQQFVHISKKSCLVETKKDKLVDEEFLTDFVLHDENGVPQPLEMLEFDDMFTSGLILHLEESSDKEKVKVIRCEGFGWLESWDISGYEDGSPVILLIIIAIDLPVATRNFMIISLKRPMLV